MGENTAGVGNGEVPEKEREGVKAAGVVIWPNSS